MSEDDPGGHPIDVLIIGAGAAGLCMAARLEMTGRRDFLILEKSDGVGGTWRDNSYPDSGCDVPSHLYSFSFAPNPRWSRKWAKQPEILAYFEGIPSRFGFEDRIRTATEVSEASWSGHDGMWTVRTADGLEIRARVLVNGLGQLNMPHVPDIEGLADFEGTRFHSARWDHDHDLAGERVGVVGIGASAIQFVPPVAARAGHLTLFQRTPNYVVPKPDREFSDLELFAFEHLPGVRRAYRWSIYWRLETKFNLMRRGSWLGRLLRDRVDKELSRIATDRLPREVLVPDYLPGCRRLLISDDWYPTLMRDDVLVTDSAVERITSDGIVTADGTHHRLDTIIFGTGFTTTDFLTPMKVTGVGGRDLNEAWASGPVAYLGLAVADFPNMFILYGPNTNLGHNSILFMIEQQVSYVLAALEQLERRGASSVEVRADALARWDAEMLERGAETVWAGDCSSWYKTDDGRITNNWVGHTTEYRRRLHSPDWDDWDFRRMPAPAPAGS